MSTNELNLLHIYAYSKPKGERCPLRTFNQSVNPLAISTCMRHVYIYTDAQLEGKEGILSNLIGKLKDPGKHQAPSKYEHLKGSEAYALLLYWVVGGLNNKNPFHDLRILGDLRKTLHTIEHSKKKSNITSWLHNKEVANSLRRDGKNLLDWVKNLPKDLELDKNKDVVMNACRNCAWAREEGLLDFMTQFDYENFVDSITMKEHISEMLDYIELKVKQEQEKIHNSLGDIGFLFSLSNVHLEEKLEQVATWRSKLFPEHNLSLNAY